MKLRHCSSVCCALIFRLVLQSCGAQEGQTNFDVNVAAKAARDISSIYLTAAQKEDAVRTFVKLISIRSPSGKEDAICEELRNRLASLQGVEIALGETNAAAPHDLVMEFPASTQNKSKPGILLNAHVDTINTSTPDLLRYDAAKGDFYHANEGKGSQSTSFGADDKAGVAVIVECLAVLKERFWSTNAPHRRIVVAFTGSEERGAVGARYLKTQHPDIFGDLEISLTFDGPIDYQSDYPASSFILVVSEQDARRQPYQRVLELAAQVAEKKNAKYSRTEIGLGMGDFAEFPASAHSGLHIRAPHRGFHSLERARLTDLINHVDLLCHILLAWDQRSQSN